MTSEGLRASLIWATRGRTWGFRFLLDGGQSDPLTTYERAFAHLPDDPTAYERTDDGVALRFPDPLSRRDASGRPIPHDFVVAGDLADSIHSVDDGIATVWPLVAKTYAKIWDRDAPPSADDVGTLL